MLICCDIWFDFTFQCRCVDIEEHTTMHNLMHVTGVTPPNMRHMLGISWSQHRSWVEQVIMPFKKKKGQHSIPDILQHISRQGAPLDEADLLLLAFSLGEHIALIAEDQVLTSRPDGNPGACKIQLIYTGGMNFVKTEPWPQKGDDEYQPTDRDSSEDEGEGDAPTTPARRTALRRVQAELAAKKKARKSQEAEEVVIGEITSRPSSSSDRAGRAKRRADLRDMNLRPAPAQAPTPAQRKRSAALPSNRHL